MKLRWFGWALAIGIALGCGGGGSSVNEVPDPVVRFINASPNSTAAEAFVDDIQIASNQAYLGTTSTFVAIEDGGLRDIAANEVGNLETMDIQALTMNLDTDYLAVGVGLMTPPNTDLNQRFRVSFFNFDRRKPNAQKARIVLVHGYVTVPETEMPAVDFRSPAGDNPVVNEMNIAFAGNRVFEVNSGSLQYVIRRNGTEFDLLGPTTVTLESGKIYAAILSGVEGGAGAQAPQVKFIELASR